MYEESKRKHYDKNRERYIEQAKARKLELKELVRSLKDRPCEDCSKKYPFYVMQFDHVRGKKIGNVATLIEKCNKQLLLDEIAKCDVVCANCHAERTWSRLQ